MDTRPDPFQGELLPHRSPQSVLDYLERARRRIARMAAQLYPEDCARLLGELALLELALDRMERHHEAMRAATAPRVTTSAPSRAQESPGHAAPATQEWAQRQAARTPPARWRQRAHSARSATTSEP